jgi:hypothetical protein
MNLKQIFFAFCLIAPIVLFVSLVVAYLYGVLAHGAGVMEWESSIRFAIILGIVLPIIRQLDNKKAA